MNAFFIGAGASCGTFQDSNTPVPVAAQFGRVLEEIDPNWTQRYPDIFKLVSHLGLPKDNWGLEPVWSCMDYYAKFKQFIPKKRDWSNESPQLKKALLHMYGRRCDDAAEQLPLTDSYTLGRLLKSELTAGDVLISFNYDTIVERLARRFGHEIRSVGAMNGKNVIALAKPHGSTTWTLDRSVYPNRVISVSANGSVLLDSLSPKDVDNKREPLLLGAVPIKSELIREVQEVCGSIEVFDTVARQWNSLIEAIRDADSLVIVGYSFPREDQHGRFLIQEGMRLRHNTPSIEFYELKGKAQESAKAIMDAFGGVVPEPTYRGEVVPPE